MLIPLDLTARPQPRPAARCVRCWLPLVLGALLSVLSRPAVAQTSNTGLVLSQTRIELASGEEYRRPVGRRPFWISYDDCIRDDAYVLPIDANSSTGNIEVWAGNEDCAANRPNTQDRGQCWLVMKQAASVNPVDLQVPMRAVVARDLDADTDPPANLGPEVCSRGDSLTGEAITYFILRVNGGQVLDQVRWGGGNGAADTGIDVLGPSAPSGGIELKVGENQLIVEVDETEDNSDLARFRAYCVPVGTPGTPILSDAGVTPDSDPSDDEAPGGDAGTGDAGLAFSTLAPGAASGISFGSPSAVDAGVGSCSSQVLTAGELPTPQARTYDCGEMTRTSRRHRTTFLENGVTYAVAMAAEDDIGNAGELSNVACATPIQLDDFFESYKEQGGPGGGGFCSLQQSPQLARSRGQLGWAWLCLVALALRRRRAASGARSNMKTQEPQ